MPAKQVAVLQYKLGFLEQWNVRRASLAAQYDQALGDLPLQRPVLQAGNTSSNHLYVLQCADRDALRAHLESKSIGTQIHYPTPLHHQPAYREQFGAECVYPNAERACDRVLSLPLYPELGGESVEYICEAVNYFFTE